jgi:hypothetical protein
LRLVRLPASAAAAPASLHPFDQELPVLCRERFAVISATRGAAEPNATPHVINLMRIDA